MPLSLLPDAVRAYIDRLVPPRPAEMERMEAFAREHDFPIIGPASGQCCYLVTRLAGARRVFEMGSGYGYSTGWFARGVRENGGGEVHQTIRSISGVWRQHKARFQTRTSFLPHSIARGMPGHETVTPAWSPDGRPIVYLLEPKAR